MRYLVDHRVDAIETTPTYLRQMLAAGLLTSESHRPRVIALGGEAVDDGLREELAADPDLLVFNFYGPTETTVNAVTARISGGSPVIGRPVSGAGAYVLDPSLHPQPRGSVGELYLSGEGVARGYAGRPGLTAERFMPDPFGPPGARMYRTGDLARWSGDGSLEFVGRSDRQIKVRGVRVETGEVEAALRSLPGVEDAAVALTTAPDGPERLAAFLVAGAGAPDHAEARDAVAALLPGPSVPTAWATVERLPLTPNGKLDLAALPPALPVASDGGVPRTPLEARMCAVFAACLWIPRVGRDDDFFALGGHSLLAMRLIGRIRGEFGAEVPISTLFSAPTPVGLVAALGEAAAARRPVTAARPRPQRLPLSFGQQRLWLLETLGDAGASYHLPVVLRLRGALDREALELALHDVLERHETLRTIVAENPEGPCQKILPPARLPRPLLRVMAAGEPLRRDAAPFDLACEIPLRARLFPFGAEDNVLLVTLHHTAADGWSMGPLMRDLATAYGERRSGRKPSWGPLPVQYADFALWQRDLLGDPDTPDSLARRQLSSWAESLAGLPEESTFPTDRPRPARTSGRGGRVPVRIGAQDHRTLVKLAGDCGASSFMVLHAALAALMSRLGAGDDIAVGTPVAGLTDEALTELVGFFVNTLVLRADTSGSPAFRTLVERVARTDVAAYARQDVPFERVVEELAPPRSLARHPLFQVMLSLNNTPTPRPRLDGLAVTHETSVGRSGSKFDLSWNLSEHHDDQGRPDGITGELEYDEDLFDRTTAERFADHFSSLLSGLLSAPERPITGVGFLTPSQRAAALGEPPPSPRRPLGEPPETWTGTADDDWTVLDVLATRAAAAPRQPAIPAATFPLSFSPSPSTNPDTTLPATPSPH
ncbi:condensation domain-containing protein [Streptomyces sp. WZ.A104]|uniref:condensation domain-containing protein n=1 Tax=Streptomyces sp. WZ.A104 TaxID=2023771 RepID=UPI00359C77AF